MLAWVEMAAVAFGVGLSGALSPGPLTVLAIREGARRGWRAGPLATAGHAIAEATAVLLLALGLSATVADGSTASALIGLGGGAAMIAMGARLARSLPGATLAAVGGSGASHDATTHAAAGASRSASPRTRATSWGAGLRAVVPAGIVVSLANPYWWVWWATVGTKLTADSLAVGRAGPTAVFGGHILSDLLWLTFVAGLVGSGARWMDDRAYRALLGVCAAFLVVLGVLFVASGVRVLR